MAFWDFLKYIIQVKEVPTPVSVKKAIGNISKPKTSKAADKLNQNFRNNDLGRWANDKSVIGYTIRRSNNCNANCELCDKGAGDYPKDFIWKGWHDKCMCFVVPITMSDNDYDELLDREDDGKPTKRFIESKLIKKIPSSLKNYVRKHRIELEALNHEWFTSNDKYLK